MSQSLRSILETVRQLPPDELQQLLDHLLTEISSELKSDDQLRKEVLTAEQQIARGEVVPWSEVKRRHRL